MALDRRITVRVEAEGSYNEHGEFEPGAITDYPAWATRMDRTLTDIAEEGGQRTETRRDWRLRWRSEIASTPSERLSVIDGGTTFSVENLVEVTADGSRRRFLEIQGLATV